mgnify:CR=1 FL=1
MQDHLPHLKVVPQVLTIGKPNHYKPSFNSSNKPSFNPPANTPSPPSTETSNFSLQDFLFIPKLLNLGRDVHAMASQGMCSGDVTARVKERFTALYDNPSIALNVNVHVRDASANKPSCNVAAPAKTYQFLINVGNVQARDTLKPHLDTNIESHSLSNEKAGLRGGQSPSPARSPELGSPTKCNFSADKDQKANSCASKAARIRKRKTCNCVKRRSLEELIRQERSFNKQIEKVRCFWKGGNSNHPFMFRKKLMDYYTETEEAAISEVLDFSKKAINAEDMHLSISDK